MAWRHNSWELEPGIKTHVENLWVEMIPSMKDKCYEVQIFRMWSGGLICLRGWKSEEEKSEAEKKMKKEEQSRKTDSKAAADLPYNSWALCTWLVSTTEPSWVTIAYHCSGARLQSIGLSDHELHYPVTQHLMAIINGASKLCVLLGH